jgi:hypothetical protein
MADVILCRLHKRLGRAALSVAGHGLNDFDTQAGKRSVDSKGWFEIDCEYGVGPSSRVFLLDSQSQNDVLRREK